jgi:RimJ/RimL family protein N-acetyltransferase
MQRSDGMASSISKPPYKAAMTESSARSRASRSEPDSIYLFYCHEYGAQSEGSEELDHPHVADDPGLDGCYRCAVWTPPIVPILPRNLPGPVLKARFLFRWSLHRFHIFAGRESGALLIYHRQHLIHYSGFTPRYWRFPFIADGDFQIGDTWTDPEYRGKGLALFAVRKLVGMLERPGRRIWYVVESRNYPSIRVVEKAGFELVAEGLHLLPFGLTLAGSYVPQTQRLRPVLE